MEVRGLKASAIQRRKPLGEPVLETYQFLTHTQPPKERTLRYRRVPTRRGTGTG